MRNFLRNSLKKRQPATNKKLLALLLGAFFFLPPALSPLARPGLSFAQFDDLLLKGLVRKIVVEREDDTAAVYVYDQRGAGRRLNVVFVQDFLENLTETLRAQGLPAPDVYYRTADGGLRMLLAVCALTALLFELGRRGLQFRAVLSRNVGEYVSRKASWSKIENISTRFADVAGLDNAKLEVAELVEFLKNPARFHRQGARLPRGALLSGPPGTGKTMLAKACAKEAGVSFFSVAGSEFVEKYAGLGAANVRKLFEAAKRHAPAIIFIDELDAVGKKREAGLNANTERENTLNQLLVEMDGFSTADDVIVMAATNRPEGLDGALTRPGRFDRHIQLTLPDIRAREAILALYLRGVPCAGAAAEVARRLATLTPGFAGADLANLVNEAAICAAREDATVLETRHFEEAAERVIGGLRRSSLVTEDERRLVAFHESGHAVASWFLPGADPLVKVTIVPRSKGALGYAQYLVGDMQFATRSELLDRIAFVLGGRAAEELFFGQLSTGASDDLQKAFELAQQLVLRFGMAPGFERFSLPEKRPGAGSPLKSMELSEESAALADARITEVIAECYHRCSELLRARRAEVERLAAALLEREAVDLRELTAVLGPRPGEASEDFREYLRTAQA